MKVGINGMGRIGRLVYRAWLEGNFPGIKIVAVNDIAAPSSIIHLLNYDSIHGNISKIQGNLINSSKQCVFLEDNVIKHDSDFLGRKINDVKFLNYSHPNMFSWSEHNVDVVLECSGRFKNTKDILEHIYQGAKYVLTSAPLSGADYTVVFGVNHNDLNASHRIISNASCTTNALAPVLLALDAACAIEKAHITTVHSYTADQSLVDQAHSDPRRARAACLSMIPTTTGAATCLAEIIPHFKDKINGSSVRVPTPNVSMLDIVAKVAQPSTVEAVNSIFKMSAQSGDLGKVLGVSDLPLVSLDYNHTTASAIVDLSETKVIDGDLIRVLAWYDNEWAFANRMLDVASLIANFK